MKTGMNWQSVTLATIISGSLLGGCLSKDDADVAESVRSDTSAQNNPPTISGNPRAAATTDSSYSFTPTASDPDGDDLTFSVTNLPSWTRFDTSTGEVSGQPSLADVGVFPNIVISVSDGIYSASLPGYSITVSQTALGSLTLSWTPPTTNTDGTTLTDLSGYRIYYGNSQGNYPNQISIDTPGIASYVVENLVPDTYYFVATSLNSLGVESSYSNVAIKTVQ